MSKVKQLPTIAEAEKSSRWISAANSGYTPNQITAWRKAGWLKPKKDCVQKQVRFEGGPQARVWLYRPSSLAAAAAKEKALKEPRGVKLAATHERFMEVTEGDDVLFQQKAAAAYFGDGDRAKAMLLRLTKKGILTTVERRGFGGLKTKRWYRSQLERVARELALRPREVNDKTICPLREAMELLGLSERTLKSSRHQKRLKLIPVKRRMIAGKKEKGSFIREMNILVGFTRKSVDAALAARPAVVKPPSRMTSSEAAERMNVDRRTANQMFDDGILRGESGQALDANAGVKTGNLFYRADVETVRNIRQKAEHRLEAARQIREWVKNRKPLIEENSTNAQTLPTIWRHGTRDYSRDGLRIVRVSPEHENILRAFLETGKRMTTPELEKFGSSNVPQAIDRLTKVGNGVFSDAIQKPDGVRGLGYFIRVRPIAEMD